MAIDNELKVRLLHVAKTQNQWTAVASTYPKRGEVCLEAINTSGSTAFKIKIGDGSRPYCRNTGTSQAPVWDFTSEYVLPYFGTVITAGNTLQVLQYYTYPTDSSESGYDSTLAGKTVFRIHQLSIVETAGETVISVDTTNYKEIRPGSNVDFAADSQNLTISVPDGSVSQKGAVQLLNSYTESNKNNTTNATTNKVVTDVIGTLDQSTAQGSLTINSNNKLEFRGVTETNGIIGTSDSATGSVIDIVGDVTTSDTGNSGIEVTTSNTTKNVHHKTVTQSNTEHIIKPDPQTQLETATEGVVDLVTNVSVDNYGHITGKETITSDKIIAADIKAPVTKTDNTTWNYRETGGEISIGEDIARVSKLKGNTIVWNQIFNETRFTNPSTDNCTVTKQGDVYVVKPNAGATFYRVNIRFYDLTTNHKYYISTNGKYDGSGVGYSSIQINDGSSWREMGREYYSSSFQRKTRIVTVTTTIAQATFNLFRTDNGADTDEAQIYDYMLIDLTKMFGSDDAIKAALGVSTLEGQDLVTAAANFEKLFPNPYYPYCEGRLVNLGGYGVKWNQLYDTTIPTAETGHKYYLSEVVSSTKTSSISTTISYTTGSTNRMCIDLTMMFGPDSEPTLEEFEAMFPADYYEYNAGTEMNIFDAIGDKKLGLVSTGFNQWDEIGEIGNVTSTTGQNGNSPSGTNWRSVNYIPVIPGGTYYCKSDVTTFARMYDSNKNFVPEGNMIITNSTFDIPLNVYYLRFVTATLPQQPICINISSSRNGEYEPYKSSTLDLSWVKDIKYTPSGSTEEQQLFPYGLLSAGSVYDEVGENYAIKRVGVLDFSNLTWTDETDYIQASRPQEIANTANTNYITTIPGITGILLTASFIRVQGLSTTTFPQGSLFYYELATPVVVYFDEKKRLNYPVNDHGTEQQLPVNGSSVITSPFVGTFEYKSNFKDAVIDLIDTANSYKNPVKSVYNTPQTSGKLAVYDSDSTVASSSHFVDLEATIETGDTINRLPTVQQMIDYVTASQASALQYKGTVSSYDGNNSVTSKVTSDIQSGWLYFIDTQFTLDSDETYLPAGTYNIGDFIVWNETNNSFDVITGVHNIDNRNITLAFGSTVVTSQTIATVDGIPITVGMPVLDIASSTSGNTNTFIDSITYNNDTVSVTKKNIPDASSTTKGIVDIINVESATSTTPDNSVSNAYDLLQALNHRDVGVGSLSTISTYSYGTLHKRALSNNAWTNSDFYPITKFDVIAQSESILGGGGNTGYLKRKSSGSSYVWELDPYGGSGVMPYKSNVDGTGDVATSSKTTAQINLLPTAGEKILARTALREQVGTDDYVYHKISVGALENDTNIVLILNGNFN